MIPRNAPGGHAIDHMRLLAIDSIRSHIYIAPMAEDANVMFEHELKRLEKRVDALVARVEAMIGRLKAMEQGG